MKYKLYTIRVLTNYPVVFVHSSKLNAYEKNIYFICMDSSSNLNILYPVAAVVLLLLLVSKIKRKNSRMSQQQSNGKWIDKEIQVINNVLIWQNFWKKYSQH